MKFISNTPLPIAKICCIYCGSRNFGLGLVWVNLLHHRLTPLLQQCCFYTPPVVATLYAILCNHVHCDSRWRLLGFPSDLLSRTKHCCMETVVTGRRLFHATPERLQRVPRCPVVSTFSCRCTCSVGWRWSGRLLCAIGLCQAWRVEEWASWGCTNLISLG